MHMSVVIGRTFLCIAVHEKIAYVACFKALFRLGHYCFSLSYCFIMFSLLVECIMLGCCSLFGSISVSISISILSISISIPISALEGALGQSQGASAEAPRRPLGGFQEARGSGNLQKLLRRLPEGSPVGVSEVPGASQEWRLPVNFRPSGDDLGPS